MPGTYQVALVAGGKTLDTRTMKIVMDPEVKLTDIARRRYNDVVTDLHDLQQRGTNVAASLNKLYPQMSVVAPKVASSSAPEAVKSQFAALVKDFDAIRARFGVPLGAGGAGGGRGGGGGGGGRGGAVDTLNVLARTGTVKNAIGGIWETPSDALMNQYTKVKTDLPKAIADANAFLARAQAMAATLKRYDITLTVPKP